jgi:hypothetical protein
MRVVAALLVPSLSFASCTTTSPANVENVDASEAVDAASDVRPDVDSGHADCVIPGSGRICKDGQTTCIADDGCNVCVCRNAMLGCTQLDNCDAGDASDSD